MHQHLSLSQTLLDGVLYFPRRNGHDRPGTSPTPAGTFARMIKGENEGCGQSLRLFSFKRGVRTEIPCSASSNTFAESSEIGRAVIITERV
jgi:hypothetical protein